MFYWSKICCIFDFLNKSTYMRPLKFKINPETIRKANRISVVRNNNNISENNSYTGVITARIIVNGVEQSRELSRESIDMAYLKSLKEYAEKL